MSYEIGVILLLGGGFAFCAAVFWFFGGFDRPAEPPPEPPSDGPG